MPTPHDNSSTDGDLSDLKPKKEKVIQPLSKFNIKPNDTSVYGATANDDLLAELRAKTAMLAEQVHGHEGPANRVLKLEDNTSNEEDFVDSLKQEKPEFQQPKTETIETFDSKGNPAVELVRQKLANLYKKEPDAKTEAIESFQAGKHRSKHQMVMYNLSTSGKSLADIQTQWHAYYTNLPDDEKHQVWQEFYENQASVSAFELAQPKAYKAPAPALHKRSKSPKLFASKNPQDPRTVGEIKNQLYDKVSAGGKLTAKQHFKSLLFGLGLASLVGLIITFTFFNEVFIAPFISPSKSVSATPIIGNQTGDVGPESKIIIPKINLEVPVVFGMTTIDEGQVQAELENGVVHYASTPNPGESGNVAIVGHSSNNILNKGKYKFAFVLLKKLEAEDTFFVQKDGIRYTYKVYKKEVVGPENISVLDTQEKPNTITLVTCDPPGTSINRLIITAEQISPDPVANKPSTAIPVDRQELDKLPSNAPSLWSRIWPF